MTKVEELRTESQCPRGTARHPAGLESALQHQSAAAAPRPLVDMDATGLKPGHGEGVVGLQLRSPACLWPTCDATAMAERTAYLDLCLIFLLLRFSL